ncbi:Snf7 family protein [Kipferlia bialata]|uniref:Snf7 family protein n=1 Tax=Kipferlia bialata TaxID=797122 RepID=A0A391NLD5_9EUKA|nr:Snf7 family protein [Kipferlia bialata]|eukprot:g683.t1
MGAFFSRHNAERDSPMSDSGVALGSTITQMDMTILRIRQQETKLNKQRKHYTLESQKLRAKAMEAKKAHDMTSAVGLLKQSKMWDKQVSVIDGLLFQCTSSVLDVENADTQVSFVTELEKVNEHLDSLRNRLSLDHVEDVMTQGQELRDHFKEVDAVMAEGSNVFTEEDGADIQAQLDEWAAEEAAETLAGLEAAPTSPLPASTEDVVEPEAQEAEAEAEAEAETTRRAVVVM